LVEDDADREIVHLLDLDVLIGRDADRSGRRIRSVLPVEYDIIGGERLAVVPLDARLELPGYRLAVGGEAAVFAARNLCGEDRDEIALGVPAGERLVE
jgi:hypothetical protein